MMTLDEFNAFRFLANSAMALNQEMIKVLSKEETVLSIGECIEFENNLEIIKQYILTIEIKS